MHKTRIALIVLLISMVVTSVSFADVMIYRQAKKGSIFGVPCLQVIATPATGGKPVTLNVPNEGDHTKYNPTKVVTDVLKELKPGEAIRVTHTAFQGKKMIRTFAKYPAKPGESESNAFVFQSVEKMDVKGRPQAVVTASKYEVEVKMVVSLIKGEDGKMTPDPKLLSRLEALSQGDVIVVKAKTIRGRPMLLAFANYAPPVTAEFVRMDAAQDNPAAVSLVVKVDGEEKTIALPTVQRGGKPVADPKLLGKLKGLKAGQTVLYQTSNETGEVRLENIKTVKATKKKG